MAEHDDGDPLPWDGKWISQQVVGMVRRCVAGDVAGALDFFASVIERYGVEGEFAVLVACADLLRLVQGLEVRADPDDGFYGMALTELRVGDGVAQSRVVDPDEAGHDDAIARGIISATRFIVAHLNDDKDTVAAIFVAAQDDCDGANLIYGMFRLLRDIRDPLVAPSSS